MKIKRLRVTGYKNLVGCEIKPSGIHAITGFNGSGKSNLLEVLPFLANVISSGEEVRSQIFRRGYCPKGQWFPHAIRRGEMNFLEIRIDAEISAEGKNWSVAYELTINFPDKESENPVLQENRIIYSEAMTIKALGTPGKSRRILERTLDGKTSVTYEKRPRVRLQFQTNYEMSALQSLEVREANRFAENFPVVSHFRNALLSAKIYKLDPVLFQEQIEDTDRSFSNIVMGLSYVIASFDPYPHIKRISSDSYAWEQYKFWLKKIGDIDEISIEERPRKNGKGTTDPKKYQFIATKQHGRSQRDWELSTGSVIALGIVTTLFSLLPSGGILLIDEPESYLHPSAIENLVKLFRELCENSNIIFVTHSPTVINAMRPEEVTVMSPSDFGFMTTKSVSDIQEAIDALNRGFFSLGDLLQSDFKKE